MRSLRMILPDPRHARVVLLRPDRAAQLLGVLDHGAELVHAVVALPLAHPHLGEKDRAGGVEPDGDAPSENGRGHEQEPEQQNER